MKEQFLKVAFQRHFFDKHNRVLVAVSGGLDSMNLLHLLESCQTELAIDIGLAHIHHGQRPESDQEVLYLEKYAREKGLPFHLAYFTDPFSEKKARDFRYQFFKRIMKTENYTAVVTAHHADDQAETVLMRLLRGSRLLHLSAIKERQNFAGGELIRPLLTFSKADLPEIFHFEDSSNSLEIYFRNRLRHSYLPQLTRENPKLKQHLCGLAQEASDLKDSLSYFIKDIDYTQLPQFYSYPKPIQQFFLQDYLSRFPDLQVSKQQFEEILYLLREKKNKVFPLKSGYELVLDYRRFKIRKINPQTDSQKTELLLKLGDLETYEGYQFGFNTKIAGADEILNLPSAEAVKLRHRQAGDTILYQGYHKKLRRLFIEKKVSMDRREVVPVIEQDGKILSILGIATSDLSKSLKSDTITARLYIKKQK